MAYDPRYIRFAIESLCPVTIHVDYELYDQGQGPFISAWHRADITQPTPAQYEAVDTAPLAIAASVPQSVTPRQARLALLNAGLLDTVNSQITTAGGTNLITWEYASTIERNDPLILSLGASLNLTSAQIDALFVQAATL